MIEKRPIDAPKRAWESVPNEIDSSLAKEAKEELFSRISAWLTRLLDYPGFKAWKDEVVRRQITFAILPNLPVEFFDDFHFDQKTIKQHDIVTSYMRLMGAANDCRMVQYYFRRFSFRNLPVGREEHIRTCCELYYSRIYQFEQRLKAALTLIERRTIPKGLKLHHLRQAFHDQLKVELEERNQIHHQAAYSDFEVEALGVTDLLSSVSDNYPRMTAAHYRRLTRHWGERVKATAERLDFWVGVVAVLLLARCPFLVSGAESLLSPDR